MIRNERIFAVDKASVQLMGIDSRCQWLIIPMHTQMYSSVYKYTNRYKHILIDRQIHRYIDK